jgi:hypothetical protein
MAERGVEEKRGVVKRWAVVVEGAGKRVKVGKGAMGR